ncbi:hypothetical protein AJ79_04313 [Helicocarpus griseus UAMH5409]|uniref:Methyltransferase domain-containing protein n=1 Tax=Helicocarpus griseus UAMH5409 TaxID=1447875 RepID=A0A2B7XTV5_9EURO|nr:hypothetical protein AJ79_04313 [Helicocarpus griseus UAMH5409]
MLGFRTVSAASLLRSKLSLVKDTITEEDSTYEESTAYATSLSSSVLNYKAKVDARGKFQNGRRYTAFREGEYILPNDETEQSRMHLEHHIYRTVLDGDLYRAPIGQNPARVLDFGTGNGNWAIDFADQHPESTVIGCDLSPIQPTWYLHSSPSCKTNGLIPSEAFNYIHSRDMAGSIANFDKLFAQCFKHLKPGGYLEMQTFGAEFYSDDGTLAKAKHTLKWRNLLIEASNKFGKPLNVEGTWKEKMEKAGFVDVQQDVYKVPISTWPKDKKMKELAQYELCHLNTVLEAYTLALFTRVLKWNKKEIDVLLEGVKSDLKNRSNHIYGKIHFFYARKPE